MYKPFIIGLSTYYGGYGLTYDSMEELKQQFREELNKNPEIDFLEEFKKGRKASINRHFSYYVMSAFISEKVIKDKGFDAILDLAYSGRKGELFFEKLNNIINVNEANFHETILELIKAT